MKKIGIITFIHNGSYGAFLQAYALQYALNKKGYNAEVIDIVKPTTGRFTKLYLDIKGAFNLLKKGDISSILKKYKTISRARNKFTGKTAIENVFYDFFYNQTKHSAIQYTANSIYNANLDYDVVITGSDQVWNYMMTSRLDVYFLKFAKNAKRISYAASFGISTLPFWLKREYKSLIKNIHHISVREKEGAILAKKLLKNSDPLVVVDPTLLVPKNEWTVLESKVNNIPSKYILVYNLKGSDVLDQYANEVSTTLNAEIIRLKDYTPNEFIYLINNALYIVTSSYHGTVFSINFNKPFTTILRKSKATNSRLVGLLESAGLGDRILFEEDAFRPNIHNISFEKANDFLIKGRNKSLEFLEKSINN